MQALYNSTLEHTKLSSLACGTGLGAGLRLSVGVRAGLLGGVGAPDFELRPLILVGVTLPEREMRLFRLLPLYGERSIG